MGKVEGSPSREMIAEFVFARYTVNILRGCKTTCGYIRVCYCLAFWFVPSSWEFFPLFLCDWKVALQGIPHLGYANRKELAGRGQYVWMIYLDLLDQPPQERLPWPQGPPTPGEPHGAFCAEKIFPSCRSNWSETTETLQEFVGLI